MAVTKKAAKKRVLKIWHIFRFGERFELRDDWKSFRKGPLIYTKDFVGGGSDDESISFQLQMNILKSFDDYLMLKGAFGVLKELAANRSRCYRGYLLDEKLKPASEKRISQWLGIDVKATANVLKQLAEAGLIERIDVPEWDTSVNEEPSKGPDGGKKKNSKRSTAARSTAGPLKTAKKQKPRTKPENSGPAGKPFREKNKRQEIHEIQLITTTDCKSSKAVSFVSIDE